MKKKFKRQRSRKKQKQKQKNKMIRRRREGFFALSMAPLVLLLLAFFALCGGRVAEASVRVSI